MQQAKLTASDAAVGDVFGVSVSVSGDTILIGTPGDDDDDNGLGNSGSAYVFSLKDTGLLINALINQVIALNLQKGISNSLDAKLDRVSNALADVNENNDVAAINSLEAFINAVEAQSGGFLTLEEANACIDLALDIIDLLAST